MTGIEAIRLALAMSDEGLNSISADMRDAALVQPGVRDGKPAGNHTLWLLGHVAYIEGQFSNILFGEPNPVEKWAKMFAPGTQPLPDAGSYPPFDDVVSTCREMRARNAQALERIGEAGLDQRPRNVPAGFEDAMKTVGQAFILLSLHRMVHYGQIADARRAAGRAPLL